MHRLFAAAMAISLYWSVASAQENDLPSTNAPADAGEKLNVSAELRDLQSRIDRAIIQFETGPGDDPDSASQFYEEMASLAEQVSVLILPAIENFAENGYEKRSTQIEEIWPLIEFSIVAAAVTADNMDSYFSAEETWKLVYIRRLVTALRSVWSTVVPYVLDEALSAGQAQQLLSDTLLFVLLNADNIELEEIGEALSADPVEGTTGLDAEHALRRSQMKMLLADFGLEGLSGTFVAAWMINKDHSDFTDRLDEFVSRFLLTAAASWPDLQRASREADGRALILTLAGMIDRVQPVLSDALPVLSEALTSKPEAVPEKAEAAVENTQAAPETADAAEDAVTPAAPPVLLPDAAIADLRESLTLSDGYLSDSELENIVTRFSKEGQAAAFAQTLAQFLLEEGDYNFHDHTIKALRHLGPDALAAEGALRTYIVSSNPYFEKPDVARILSDAGADLSDVAAATAAKLDNENLRNYEKEDALRLLGAMGPLALPHISRFLAYSVSQDESERSTGLRILQNLDTLYGTGWERNAFETYYKNYFSKEPEQAALVRTDLETLVGDGTDDERLVWLFNAAGGNSAQAAERLIAGAEEAAAEELYPFILPFVHLTLPDSGNGRVHRFLMQHLENGETQVSKAAMDALLHPHFATELAASDVRRLLKHDMPHVRKAGILIAASNPTVAGQIVDELVALLETPDIAPPDRYDALRALQSAGDRASPAAEIVARSLLVDKDLRRPATSILSNLGSKAKPAISILETAIVDSSLDATIRVVAASVLFEILGEDSSKALEALAQLAPADPELLSEVFTWTTWQSLGKNTPLNQTYFDWLGSLVLKISGHAQNQAIQAYIEFWRRSSGFDREVWRGGATALLLDLPIGENERSIVTAFLTLETPDRQAFDRVLNHARTMLQTYDDQGDKEYDVYAATENLRRLANLVPETGEDGRRSEAIALYLDAFPVLQNTFGSEMTRGLGELGPYQSPMKERVYQILSAQMESSPESGGSFNAAADAAIRLAASSGDFLQPVLNQIRVQDLDDENSREKIRHILRKLAEADKPVIGQALETLTVFYLQPTADDAPYEITSVKGDALVPVAALGQDVLVYFEQFAREKDKLGFAFFTQLERVVNAMQDEFHQKSSDELTTAIGLLQSMRTSLTARKNSEKDSYLSSQWEEADSALARATSAAEDKKVVISANWWAGARKTLTSNPYILAGGSYIAALLGVLLFSLIAPLWALNSYQALARITTGKPKLLGFLQAPLLLKWILLNPRVLRAWTKKNLPKAAASFRNSPTVRDRQIFHPLPVIYGGEALAEQPYEKLVTRMSRLFQKKNIVHILVRGGGGSGKTSLACKLGTDAIDGTLSSHPMIPVLIENDFANLETAIAAKLKTMLDRSEAIEKPILDELLRTKQLLVIVDHYSELGEKTRNAFDKELPNLKLNGLVVTSRTGVASLLSPVTIEQQPISRTPALSAFLESYLSSVEMHAGEEEDGARSVHAIDFLDESVISDACAHLQRVSYLHDATAAETQIAQGSMQRPGVTPLLVKIFATQITSRIKQRVDEEGDVGKIDFGDLSPTIPSIYISYVEDLRQNAPMPKQVKGDLEALAWEAVGTQFSPRPIPWERALAVFDAQKLSQEDREARLDYYTTRMGVLQLQQPGSVVNTVSFTHDPISEYLAASWVVNECGSDMAKWDEILDRIAVKNEERNATWDFLYALKLTVEAAQSPQSGIEIPDAVSEKIHRLEMSLDQRAAA
ncbi:MAG: hypothetical protein GY789_02715 [Hyphomicrobiales bacterium]|nr:hypothetical protein [Hyphomicrobiales bacterium]